LEKCGENWSDKVENMCCKLFILQEVYQALRICEEFSIVHGDLKMDNILVLEKDRGLIVKLCDFGHGVDLNKFVKPETIYRTWVLEDRTTAEYYNSPPTIADDGSAFAALLWNMLGGVTNREFIQIFELDDTLWIPECSKKLLKKIQNLDIHKTGCTTKVFDDELERALIDVYLPTANRICNTCGLPFLE